MLTAAFKEWAVIVDALGRGEQIFILRKGGIHEGRGGFRVEHDRFVLFPTLFHQQRESVIAEAQKRYDEIAPLFPAPEKVRFEYWARIVEWHQLDSQSKIDDLRSQHIWRDEILFERFEWGRTQGIFLLVTRVYRLPVPVELPNSPGYGGCKSWIQLEQPLSDEGGIPVLDDQAFAARLERLRQSLLQSAGTR